MPSPEAIKAMRRIAREKAGQPEGRVAAHKLERLAARGRRPIGKVHARGRTVEGLEVSFTFDTVVFEPIADKLLAQAVAHGWMRDIDFERYRQRA